MTTSEDAAMLAGAAESYAGRVGRMLGAVAPGTSGHEGAGTGRGMRIGVACSRFNGGITVRLLDGAIGALEECGVDRADVDVAWAPGAFELPLVARAFAAAGVDAVVCLGAVIRGETGHYDFVAGQCAAGIQRVALDTGVPVAFGVLTTDTVDQALARSTPGAANKGREAAHTAVAMSRLVRSI
jgi:6,7-dimethyl-8-ribityllumazine synthase